MAKILSILGFLWLMGTCSLYAQVANPDSVEGATIVVDTTSNDSLTGDTVAATTGKSNLKVVAPDSSKIEVVKEGSKSDLKGTTAETDGKKEGKEEKEKKPKKSKTMVEVGDKPPHDPKKAVRRSAIIPGWGQIYNGSAWKAPIIYAGFGAFTYLFIDFNKQYQTSRENFRCAENPLCNDTDPNRTAESYRTEREFYRRYRDLQVILGAVWYTLNLVDAMVEAHLKDFDVSDDLSLKIKPALQFDTRHRRVVVGGGITLKLRR